MDEQLLTTVLKRLDRIEDLINARTQNTNDRYTEIKNELSEDKSGCCFVGGSPLWLIDRGEVTKDQDFYERRNLR